MRLVLVFLLFALLASVASADAVRWHSQEPFGVLSLEEADRFLYEPAPPSGTPGVIYRLMVWDPTGGLRASWVYDVREHCEAGRLIPVDDRFWWTRAGPFDRTACVQEVLSTH